MNSFDLLLGVEPDGIIVRAEQRRVLVPELDEANRRCSTHQCRQASRMLRNGREPTPPGLIQEAAAGAIALRSTPRAPCKIPSTK
jgi:hypothetical protein